MIDLYTMKLRHRVSPVLVLFGVCCLNPQAVRGHLS